MSASIWNPNGEFLSVDAQSTNIFEAFTATEGQTLFVLSEFSYTPETGSIAVYRNGQRLLKEVDFFETAPDRITLYGISPDAGESIVVYAVIGSASESAQAAAASAAEAAAIAASAVGWPIVDYAQFTTAGGANAERKLKWNDEDGTLDLGLKGGNVVLQLGQESLVHVYNNTAFPFSDLQVVYVTGSQGQRLTAALARADAPATSKPTIAVVTEPIAAGTSGFATAFGLVRNVNTAAFSEGAELFLSAVTYGAITTTEPTSPNLAVRIGWCVRSHAVNGSIFVSIDGAKALADLSDVNTAAAVEGDLLVRGPALWEPTPSSAFAKLATPQNFTAPQRSALQTDNDGSFDLSTKQNFFCTTAGAVTLTFTNQVSGISGSVIFVNASNHTVSAHATTKLTAADLAKLSVTGTYRIDYLSNGTNAYCSVVGGYA